MKRRFNVVCRLGLLPDEFKNIELETTRDSLLHLFEFARLAEVVVEKLF